MADDKQERIETLQDRVDELEATVSKMLPSRRDALKLGAAGAVGAVGMAGSASAQNSGQTGTIGTDSDRVDVNAEDIDAVSVNTGELSLGTAGARISVDVATNSINSGSPTTVSFDFVDFDNGSFVDLTTDGLVAPVDGVYIAGAVILWDNPTATGSFRLEILSGSGDLVESIDNVLTTGELVSQEVTTLFSLSEGDELFVEVEQDTGATQEIYSGGGSQKFSYFFAALIG